MNSVLTEITETTVNDRWLIMWLWAGSLASLLKLAIWRVEGEGASPARSAIWFFAWPGMDGRRFSAATAELPHPGEVFAAIVRILIGALCVWGFPRLVYPEHPFVAGWTGMIGIVMLLHFGVFDLLSIYWRKKGIAADPIMRAPIRARSLTEFWGRRWNTGFSIPARRWLMAPLAERVGVKAAALGVFIVSGLLHELVITVPAGGGYGLPTAYFLIQGLGALVEKSGVGRRLGLGRGRSGWLFTIFLTAGPVFMLFPPVFLRNIVLPMLKAIGAFGGFI